MNEKKIHSPAEEPQGNEEQIAAANAVGDAGSPAGQNAPAEQAGRKKKEEKKEKREKSTKSEKKKRDDALPDLDDEPIFKNKKNVVRLVLFLVFLSIALGSIGYGVYRIGYKEPGTYLISPDADVDLPLYASGIYFHYTVSGGGTENKDTLAALKNEYTEPLKYSYRLFDAKTVYPGLSNIASINRNVGQKVVLPEELFDALEDAYAKTRENAGFHMFAGALVELRDALVYSYDPEASDPAKDPAVAERVKEIEKILADEESFSFEMDREEKSVCLTVSDKVKAFYEENELDCPILDLDRMADAYRVRYLAEKMESIGRTTGYFNTDSGITCLLSGYAPAEYCLYSPVAGERRGEISAVRTAPSSSAACLLRIFALYEEEEGFYTVEADGATFARNPFQTSLTADQPVASVLAVTEEGDPVAAAYAALKILSCESPIAALAAADASDCDLLIDWNDGKKEIFAKEPEKALAMENEGYRLQSD